MQPEQREEVEVSINIYEQTIQEEREQELLDVERETIASIRQEQSHDICNSVLSGKALLDRTNVNYKPNPKAQTDVNDINSEYLMKSSLNMSEGYSSIKKWSHL